MNGTAQFTHGNEKAQKYLLGAFEKLVGIEFHDQLISKTASILKTMYDCDLVDEDTFLDWSKKVGLNSTARFMYVQPTVWYLLTVHVQVSKKYVSKDIGQEIHAKAEPFLKWLREAEEEESSEEEDDEEEEVEVREKSRIMTRGLCSLVLLTSYRFEFRWRSPTLRRLDCSSLPVILTE